MKKIPCELSLGNGGDVIFMLNLGKDGTLYIPRQAKYGSFLEGVLRCQPLDPEDRARVRAEVWVDAESL